MRANENFCRPFYFLQFLYISSICVFLKREKKKKNQSATVVRIDFDIAAPPSNSQESKSRRKLKMGSAALLDSKESNDQKATDSSGNFYFIFLL